MPERLAVLRVRPQAIQEGFVRGSTYISVPRLGPAHMASLGICKENQGLARSIGKADSAVVKVRVFVPDQSNVQGSSVRTVTLLEGVVVGGRGGSDERACDFGLLFSRDLRR